MSQTKQVQEWSEGPFRSGGSVTFTRYEHRSLTKVNDSHTDTQHSNNNNKRSFFKFLSIRNYTITVGDNSRAQIQIGKNPKAIGDNNTAGN